MPDLNSFYATRPNYQAVILTQSVGTTFRLGAGINMSDPLFPIAAPTNAFAADPGTTDVSELAQPIPNKDIIMGANSAYFETETDEQEAKTLSLYFSASYREIVNGSAAYSYAHDRRQKHQSTYALIENTSTGKSFESELQWKHAPSSENEAVPDSEVLEQFVGQYGSHYIAAVTYGFRIAIRGEVKKDDQKTVENFSSAFRANFGLGGGSAGGSGSDTHILKTETTDLRAVLTAGSMDPPQAYILYGYDQIAEFLSKLKEGKISVTRAPISANLNSYFPALVNFPRSRKALEPQKGVVATAPFGVPAGTVIAWYPGNAQKWSDERGELKLAVPEGWAICDGQPGTPNLLNKFVMGTSDAKSVGITSGSRTHGHEAIVKGLGSAYEGYNQGSNGTLTNRASNLTVDVKPSDNLPPYFVLIYLVKL